MYIALVLSSDSRVMLNNRFKPVHEQLINDHVTFLFNPTLEQIASWSSLFNETVRVVVTGRVVDSKADALLVKWPELTKEVKPHLHITYSIANDVKPVYSNEMIEGSGTFIPEYEISVYGKVRLLP